MDSNAVNNNELQKNFSFDTVYEQCNNHLLESDKKRDQLLILFISITSLYVGNINILKNMYGFPIISTVMVIIGIVFALLVIEYRKWHIKYSLACNVIQRLMFMENEIINQKKITKILRSIVVNTTFKNFFKSTETLIFNLYILINFINIYILEDFYQIKIKIIYATIIIYFLILNYLNYKLIKKLCNKNRILSSSIWTINLFGRENDY